MSVSTVDYEVTSAGKPRPGSRADRMAQPLARHVLTELAERVGVCAHPLTIRRIERATGRVDGTLTAPCGARLASKCKTCAYRVKRLRERQFMEGWHLAEEPVVAPEKPTREVVGLLHLRGMFLFERDRCVRAELWDQVAELDDAIAELDEKWLPGCRIRGTFEKPDKPRKPRTVRSTKRRQDAPDLPRRKMEKVSVGRVFKGKDGKAHQPSMLLTTTLGSFGQVHTGNRMRQGRLHPCECGHLHGQADPLLGTPIDPEAYDYRGQALGLIFFAPTLDRFWQNYRRATGWQLAYAGTVEMQRRLATHAHYLVRGTVPRALTKQVAEGTYFQAWWPSFDRMVYTVDKPPVWDHDTQSYVDPKTNAPLTTWDHAMAALNTPDAQPAHVARLGTVDLRGIEGGTADAARSVKYATKYLTKDLVDATIVRSPEQRQHHQRLHEELSVLPCSPRCANWLLYGVQPEGATKDLIPGRCRGKVHQMATLGYTGRRCLVSRNWSNKTLTDHRLDGRDWFRALTAGLLEHPVDGDELADKREYIYELARRNEHDVASLQDVIFRSIAARQRARLAVAMARGEPGAAPATPELLARAA
jgi:hypothetical protein